MFIRLILLLLICFISYRETTTVGTTPRSVTGKKGSNSTLPCEFEASEISHIRLNRLSKKIHVCANEQCENCRVFKEGSCDIVIKDLRFSDAGKYILRFNYKNVTEKVEKMKTYQLKIHDEISVNTSEELKLDVLLTNADKVEHQSRISTEWTKVWTRVSNSNANVTDERLTVRDGNLTILHFKAIDAGTYRVLDSDGEILITVTVTEYSTDSGERKDDPEKTVESRVIAQYVIGALLALVAAIYAIWKSKCQNRNTGHEGYRDVPMQERVRGERGTT